LTVTTFGSRTVKNQIYVECAKGPHEAAAIALLSLFGGAITVAPIIFAAETLNLRRRARTIADQLGALERGEKLDVEDQSIAELKARLRRVDRQRVGVLYPLLFTFFVLVGFVGVDFLKIVRANQSYSFYSQSMTICRPYLDDRRAELLASQFAMVRSRDDYMNVIQQLRQVADANHLQLPNFSPW
jgi:hypothetical protein